jgi:hypothetical protein
LAGSQRAPEEVTTKQRFEVHALFDSQGLHLCHEVRAAHATSVGVDAVDFASSKPPIGGDRLPALLPEPNIECLFTESAKCFAPL